MKISNDFEIKEFAGEYICVRKGYKQGEKDTSLLLNDVTAFVLMRLNREATEEDLALMITEEFDIDLPTAKRDLHELIASLRDKGIVI